MGVRALLVYPEMPPTYWSMRYALPFLGRRAALPPLGLLTVAALLPAEWELHLIDLNVEPLLERDLEGADLVFVSAMLVQRPSFEAVVNRCRAAGKFVVAGGPFPTSCIEEIRGVDCFVLGEAEVNLPPFLRDLQQGSLAHWYSDRGHPELTATPAPRYDLVNPANYVGAALQFSRGCPHDCEFCDIIELFGHRPRTKAVPQFLAELDSLYQAGWRGTLFLVDDNFIGNRAEVRRLLPDLARWQAQRGHPFSLFTEASLDLAQDEPLLEAMVEAGFSMVFVGIETPDPCTLQAIRKTTNVRADMLASVQAIQRKGIEVSGGFIVGFDQDREDIFERQMRFIDEAAIPTAMVGLLTALPNTRLHHRLEAEGRILGPSTGGNNTHELGLNFRPRMEMGSLIEGYKRILQQVYAPRHYFARCLEMLRRMKQGKTLGRRIGALELRAFVYSLIRQTCTSYGAAYWLYLLKGLAICPRRAAEIVTLAVKGHHFFTLTRGLLNLERFREWAESHRMELEERWMRSSADTRVDAAEWLQYRTRLLKEAWRRCRRIHPDLRSRAERIFEDFRSRTFHSVHPVRR